MAKKIEWTDEMRDFVRTHACSTSDGELAHLLTIATGHQVTVAKVQWIRIGMGLHRPRAGPGTSRPDKLA